MRNLENLYIKSNRYGNEKFRENYDKISWDNDYPEEVRGRAIERRLRNFRKFDIPDGARGHFC